MRRLLALTVLLAATGCEKKEPLPTTPVADAPAAAPVAPAEPPALAPTAPSVDVASLPVEEQFEADAEKEITADNLSAKLDELEKELAAP